MWVLVIIPSKCELYQKSYLWKWIEVNKKFEIFILIDSLLVIILNVDLYLKNSLSKKIKLNNFFIINPKQMFDHNNFKCEFYRTYFLIKLGWGQKLKGQLHSKNRLSSNERARKMRKKLALTDLNAPNGSRDISFQSQKFEQVAILKVLSLIFI